MSFKSFLSAVGHDFVGVFKYLGSEQGQKTVAGLEGAAVAVGTAVGGPAVGASIAGVEALVNAGLRSALNLEAGAAAVGAQSGTGAQKLAGVVASLDSKVGDFLKSIGISEPTADQVQALSTAIGSAAASVLNAIPAPPAA